VKMIMDLEALPSDVLIHIFSFIPFECVCNVIRVCNAWNSIIFNYRYESPWKEWFYSSLWFPSQCNKLYNNTINNNNNNSNKQSMKIRDNNYWRERLLSHKTLESSWKRGKFEDKIIVLEHPDLVQHFLFKNDMLIVGSELSVKMWDLEQQKLIHEFSCGEKQIGAWSHSGFFCDNEKLAISGKNGVRIWDLNTGIFKHTLDSENTRCLAFTKDYMATVMKLNRVIKLWDPVTFQQRASIDCPEDHGVHTVQVSGDLLLTGTFHHIKTWDLRSKNLCIQKTFNLGADGKLLHFVGNTIAAGKISSNKIHIYDIRATETAHRLIELSHNPVCFALEGSKLVIGGGNKLEIWDTRSLVRYMSIPEFQAWSIQTDGPRMIYGSSRGCYYFTLHSCKFLSNPNEK